MVHPNAVILPPPVAVSPFIRFCRWGLLGAGILWGLMRQRMITRKHTHIREVEHKEEVAEDNRKVKERAIMNREELITLAKEAGLTVDENLKKQLGISKQEGHDHSH